VSSTYLRHPYHLIDYSPWPLLGSLAALLVVYGLVSLMEYAPNGFLIFIFGVISVLQVMYFWWSDVVKESTHLGCHSDRVQNGLKFGMILFIVSEIMFFMSLFWAFFNNNLSPATQIGDSWPPIEVIPVNPITVPLINTFLLLSSGYSLTWSHHALISGWKWESIISFIITLILGITFTLFQVIEYMEGSFDISDNTYGTVFYMATGFHGFHVLIGTIFLMVCGVRLYNNQFSSEHHVGFESAAWYWHFVDVVWLFVFVSIYAFGSWGSEISFF